MPAYNLQGSEPPTSLRTTVLDCQTLNDSNRVSDILMDCQGQACKPN